MNIATIVVTYNGVKWIEKCINSLINSSFKTNIIVIDNGSTDGTLAILENYTCIQVIKSTTNLGFAKANNEGIKIALTQNPAYVFLLNQDAWVERNTIEKLIGIATINQNYGIISPVHLDGSYTALDIKFANYLMPQNCPDFISDLYIKSLKPVYEIDFVNAAAWLISIKCLKQTGLFEPLFFLYGEDNNYLQRVKYHGYKIGVMPGCTICHDREIRKGKLNSTNKNWERAKSLILLLDISITFPKASLLFFKEKFRQIFVSFFKKRIALTQYQFTEIFFFVKHFNTIKATRNNYKNAYLKVSHDNS